MLHNIQADEHGPLGEEMASAVSTCVHCGFCLASCPTYKVLGQETDSPRGRIVLMKEVLEGTLPLETALPHIDPCLGCLACEPACPSGVPYRDLISPFRAQAEQQRKRSLGDKFRRLLTRMTLPYPSRFRMAAMSGRLAKPLAWALPKSLRVMLDLLPDRLPAKQTWQESYPAQGPQRGRVALLTGCAQSVLDPDINTATIDVLTRNGIEVVVPQKQVCCGALDWHVGGIARARAFAMENLDVFPNDVDAIVTNAAGCGSGMHEYPLLLKGTKDESRALEFRKKVCDVSVYMARIGQLEPFPEDGPTIRIAYHDACHLANAQGVRVEPRDLLRSIPGVEVCEIDEAHLCCGSAGTYNIDQPEIAATLGRDKVQQIVKTDASVVATGNIGCLTQIANHLSKQGSSIRVLHTMQVLRDAYAAR